MTTFDFEGLSISQRINANMWMLMGAPAQADAERATMIAQPTDSLGSVVESAVAGDFSGTFGDLKTDANETAATALT